MFHQSVAQHRNGRRHQHQPGMPADSGLRFFDAHRLAGQRPARPHRPPIPSGIRFRLRGTRHPQRLSGRFRGVYTCRAYNKLGEADTSSSVRVVAKSQLILESQHPGALEKIQYLEDASRYKRREDIDESVSIRPRFLTKPKPQEGLREVQNAHFECKLEPVQDTNLKVKWFKNGCPVTIGSRFRPIHDFGYVALDIIGLIAEDSGVYTYRAQNAVGVDETTINFSCKSSKQIVTSSETALEWTSCSTWKTSRNTNERKNLKKFALR